MKMRLVTDAERETTMATQPGDLFCALKNCEQPASAICEHCGHAYCPAHLRAVSITYRDDQRPPGMSPSARLPIRTETYALCPRCSMKPILHRTHSPAL